jgi:hypothetical protein
MKYITMLFLFVALSSCSDDKDDNAPCTGSPVAGLRVLVKDAVTSAQITSDVSVVATDGDFEEVLTLSAPYFIGVYDRQANYTVTVTKTGYQTYSEDAISVFVPGCHAVVTDHIVLLQPE